MDDNYVKYMKRCYELAVSAGKKGHDTFGAVLVHNGTILEEAENTGISALIILFSLTCPENIHEFAFILVC